MVFRNFPGHAPGIPTAPPWGPHLLLAPLTFPQTQKTALRKGRGFKVKVEDGAGPGWAVPSDGSGPRREDAGRLAGPASPGKVDSVSGAPTSHSGQGVHRSSPEGPGDGLRMAPHRWQICSSRRGGIESPKDAAHTRATPTQTPRLSAGFRFGRISNARVRFKRGCWSHPDKRINEKVASPPHSSGTRPALGGGAPSRAPLALP